MLGKTLIAPLLGALIVVSTKPTSCKYKLEVQMNHQHAFIDVCAVLSNGMINKVYACLFYCKIFFLWPL